VYNVKTAVSRLSFAPRAKDMQVTDVKTGHFVFVPKPDRPVSREELERSVTRAGYQIEDIWIEVRGAVASGGLQASGTGQTFALAGAKAGELKAPPAGAPLVVRGRWRPGPGGGTIEVDSWRAEG
jgi:hypothetical protein